MALNSLETYQWLVIVVGLITVLLLVLGNRLCIPAFMVIGRWLRWFLFGTLFTYFLNIFELSFRPDWVHLITGLALWFILETGYNWFAIKALSRSELPLFPEFYVNKDGDEWPADGTFIELKEWLQAEGYRRRDPLKAELFEGAYLRASIFESSDSLTRIQILFLPKRKGGATACYTLSTQTKGDERILTDNLFLPYGGYYPASWSMCRKPMIGSLKKLVRLHQKRLVQSKAEPIAVENDALEEINDQQRILERLNIETGFLLPRPRQEEEGKISANGRYRLWKEMWLLAYFAKALV